MVLHRWWSSGSVGYGANLIRMENVSLPLRASLDRQLPNSSICRWTLFSFVLGRETRRRTWTRAQGHSTLPRTAGQSVY
jgi:hypothetical protein